MFTQCLIVVVVILLVIDRWKPNKFVNLHQKLGNDFMYIPIIGNALSFAGNDEDRMKVSMKATLQCYKREHKAISVWCGPIFMVVLASADQANVVLKQTLHKNLIHKFAKTLIGDATIFAPVDVWRRKRKILIPSFAPKYVNKFISVFEAQNKTLVEKFKSHVGKGNFSCWNDVVNSTLDSVCETVFGVRAELQQQPYQVFLNAFEELTKTCISRGFQPWLYSDTIYKLTPVFKKQEKLKKIMHEFIDNLICKKKELIRMGENENEAETDNPHNTKLNFKTFIELMIENSKDDALTPEELRDESVGLLVAASDTTAVGICTTLLLLSQHSDIQDKVYKEIKEVIGDSKNPLQLGDLLKLKYTKVVINESLRLYPPAPFIIRSCRQDLKLPSGITLPEGTDVVINIWGIQRNPQDWGEDVNDFNPDRFMSEQIPKAFLPFSYGLRNCIGQQYAMLSITTALVSILRQYRFIPATSFTYDENNPLRFTFDAMLRHVDRYAVQIENRNKL
ncbi:cytochrome P450 4C1-like [Vanessa cardui]|uniref:cytochrome P450 4C1-like n=1 Tax=Vanessa cardui TaxID=171605 RepID=UPI001F13FF9B|nr:cytochrome P450 4C1-like [Vanessa cardui]